jgi:phosphate:Na+ symporter
MNLLFNAVGVVLMWPFMSLFAQWAVGLSESPDQAVAIANLAFNAGVALLFLPLTAWLAAKFSPKPNNPTSQALL